MNWKQLVPECLHSGFCCGAKGGGDNCSYKTCKTPVKFLPPTNQHPTFYRLDTAAAAAATTTTTIFVLV